MSENWLIGAVVGTVSATDPDGQSLTFSLDDGDGGSVPFAIDSTGKITVDGPLDYETQNSYSLQATVADPDGNEDFATVLITLGNVKLNAAHVVGWEGGTLDILIEATAVSGTISSIQIDLDRDGTFDVTSYEYDPETGGVLLLDVNLLHLLGSPVDDGVYPADLRITTSNGNVSNFEIEVAIGNLPPDTLISDPYNVNLGQPFVLSVATSDLAPDTVTSIVVGWGDGTSETFGVSSGNFTHNYASEGIYQIQITVTDEDGSWTTSTSALVGAVDPPAAPPDAPYVASAYATQINSVTMQLDLTDIVPLVGAIESISWDLDLDGIFDDAFGATVILTAAPGDAFFADVRIVDSGGFVGEAAFTFFAPGNVEVQAKKSNYRQLFKDATPAMPNNYRVHHLYEQKNGLVERLRKAGINVHDKKYLRAVPAEVHNEITKLQEKWWKKIADVEFQGNRARAYKQVDLKKFIA